MSVEQAKEIEQLTGRLKTAHELAELAMAKVQELPPVVLFDLEYEALTARNACFGFTIGILFIVLPLMLGLV